MERGSWERHWVAFVLLSPRPNVELFMRRTKLRDVLFCSNLSLPSYLKVIRTFKFFLVDIKSEKKGEKC